MAPAPPEQPDARIFAHPSGVRFAVATGWASEIDDDSMSLVSGDESAMLMFFIVDAADVEAALVGLRETLSGVVDDPRMGDGQERELNGLSAYAIRGTGQVKGTPVTLGIAVVETPSGRVLIVLGIADEDAPKATVRQIDETVKSIRPHGRSGSPRP